MKGVLESCHCSRAKRPATLAKNHKWGGCGDNIAYAIDFSRKFLDDPKADSLNDKTDSKYAAKILMDLHNNEVGRQVSLMIPD